MLYHRAMLGLGAEKYDLRVNAHADRVARWPVEQISPKNGLFCAIPILNRYLTLNHITPVR